MSEVDNSIDELHELLSILQHVDVGLVMLNREYNVCSGTASWRTTAGWDMRR